MEFPTGAGKDTVFAGLVQGKILMIEIYHVLIRSLNSLTCNFVFYCDSLVESAFSSVSSFS